MQSINQEPSDQTKANIPELTKNAVIGIAVAGGTVASAVGIAAAGTSATAAISAGGAVVGSLAGGVLGSGVGLATGGVGMAATVPFAMAGAAIGGWAGPALAIIGIGTAPAWAVPLAIGGGVVALGGALTGICRWAKPKANSESTSGTARAKPTDRNTVRRARRPSLPQH